MQIPIIIRRKEVKGKERLEISYKNAKDEWVSSLFSDPKTDKGGKQYLASVIDTEKEPFKPQQKRVGVDPNILPF